MKKPDVVAGETIKWCCNLLQKDRHKRIFRCQQAGLATHDIAYIEGVSVQQIRRDINALKGIIAEVFSAHNGETR